MHRRLLLTQMMGAAIVIVAAPRLVFAADKELTESGDFRVRVQAALRLGRQGGGAARADLERGLSDSHPAVRVACAVGLGNIGDPASVPVLERAMGGESFASVKTAMKEAIEKIQSNNVAQQASSSPVAIDKAKYVLQVGAMRNNTSVKTPDLETMMRSAARAKAGSIKDAVIAEPSDATTVKRASDRKIPILLVDGSLARLTQSTNPGGGVIVSAKVELSVRRIPQQTLKGMVSGNASASDSGASAKGLQQLQNKVVAAAAESAMSSVSSAIATFAN